MTLSVYSRVADAFDPPADPTWNDPVRWAIENVEGWTFAPYQEDILHQLAINHRAAARGPHGLGKTGMAAIAVLWFACTREAAGIDWKVVTTASNWRQLSHFLWPEIRKWARKLKQPFKRDELLTLELKLRFGQAFAVASDEPANIEGAHADEIFYLIDEAKTVLADTWDAIEGAMSTGEAYALAISTPGKAQGRFFDIQTKRPGLEDWWVRHVSLEEAIKAGRIKRSWAEQRALQWGETSPVYMNRVLGEFSTTDSDGIIPLDWIEKANERWDDLNDRGLIEFDPITCVSCDVSSTGGDQTLIAVRRDMVISEIREQQKSSTMVTAGVVGGILRADLRRAYAVIDVIGVGTGVVDRLREQRFLVDAFNGGSGSKKKDRSGELGFLNRRAEAWWGMRELLDPAFNPVIALPTNDQLLGDLTAPKWDTTSRGLVKVEEKDEIRKRLGRSPDTGDTVVTAFNGRRPTSDATATPPVSMTQISTWRERSVE